MFWRALPLYIYIYIVIVLINRLFNVISLYVHKAYVDYQITLKFLFYFALHLARIDFLLNMSYNYIYIYFKFM